MTIQGRIQDFKLGGGASLKKLRQAGGGAKIFGVFRVKNHDFTLQNLFFSNFKGGRGGTGCAPWISLCHSTISKFMQNAINDIFETVKK
jgi:hypothetical protein